MGQNQGINQINLGSYLESSISALIGRQNGKDFLETLKNNGVNIEDGNKVVIVIPDRIITMNNSYFQGFLEEAVRNCGEVNNFLEKYEFQASDHIREKIKKYAQSVMLTLTPNRILKAE